MPWLKVFSIQLNTNDCIIEDLLPEVKQEIVFLNISKDFITVIDFIQLWGLNPQRNMKC